MTPRKEVMSPNTYITLLFLFFVCLAAYAFNISRSGAGKDTAARKTPHTPPNPPVNEIVVLKSLLAEAYTENAMLKEKLRAFDAQPHG